MEKDPTSETLAANLKRLMGATEDLRTQAAVGAKAQMDQRTVGRIVNAEHAPTLTQLVKLAQAFDVEPWQLLLPKDSKLWPFTKIAPLDWHKAAQELRDSIEALFLKLHRSPTLQIVETAAEPHDPPMRAEKHFRRSTDRAHSPARRLPKR